MKWVFYIILAFLAVPLVADTNTAVVTMDLLDGSADPKVKQAAKQLLSSGVVEATIDRISHAISVSTQFEAKSDKIELSISRPVGEKPQLLLSATHTDSEWIFMESVAFRIGTNVIRLTADSPHRDVLSGGSVFETETWAANKATVQTVIKSIAAKKPTVARFVGSKRDVTLNISSQTQTNFANTLCVYFAMGGQPLTLDLK